MQPTSRQSESRSRTRQPSPPSGITFYVGVPGSGKTAQAISDAWALARRRSVPVVFVDPARVQALEAVPHALNVSELIESVWTHGRHTAISAGSGDVFEAVVTACSHRGAAVLVVDESAQFLQASGSRVSPLMLLMRTWRHRAVDVLLTTQHLSGDVSQAALALQPRLCVFRTTSPRSLEVLERDFGLAKNRVEGLARFRYLEVLPDFSA